MAILDFRFDKHLDDKYEMTFIESENSHSNPQSSDQSGDSILWNAAFMGGKRVKRFERGVKHTLETNRNKNIEY